MSRGVVARWFDNKGYGFIHPDSGSVDVFVHISQLHRSGINGLMPGDVVEYNLVTNERNGRPQAVDIRFLRETV